MCSPLQVGAAMKILILNKNKTLACDFASCALLRDNVQHHIEAGSADGRFPCLHALANLIWTAEPELLSAARMREELRAAWTALHALPFEALAVSIHTRAALQGLGEAPAVSGTVLHSATSWPLPPVSNRCETLGDRFSSIVFELFIAALQPLDGGFLRALHEWDPEIAPSLAYPSVSGCGEGAREVGSLIRARKKRLES